MAFGARELHVASPTDEDRARHANRGGGGGNRGQITLRMGHCLMHGLTVSDAKELLELWVGISKKEQATSAIATERHSGSSTYTECVTEAEEDLASFASWFEDIPEAQRRSLPTPLRNAARNLVRHRGFSVHKVAKGKCQRITEEIKAALDQEAKFTPHVEGAASASDDDSAATSLCGNNGGQNVHEFFIGETGVDEMMQTETVQCYVDKLVSEMRSLREQVRELPTLVETMGSQLSGKLTNLTVAICQFPFPGLHTDPSERDGVLEQPIFDGRVEQKREQRPMRQLRAHISDESTAASDHSAACVAMDQTNCTDTGGVADQTSAFHKNQEVHTAAEQQKQAAGSNSNGGTSDDVLVNLPVGLETAGRIMIAVDTNSKSIVEQAAGSNSSSGTTSDMLEDTPLAVVARHGTDGALHCKMLEDLRSSLQRLQEQVESQPRLKMDIERLECECSQLRLRHADLQADIEKVDQAAATAIKAEDEIVATLRHDFNDVEKRLQGKVDLITRAVEEARLGMVKLKAEMSQTATNKELEGVRRSISGLAAAVLPAALAQAWTSQGG